MNWKIRNGFRSAALQARMDAVSQRWRHLSRRDQRAVLALAGLLVLLMAWALLVRPAWRDLERGRSELPRLQYEQAQLQSVLNQIRTLEQQAGPITTPAGQEQALEHSLQALAPQCRRDSAAGDGQVIVCQSAPAAALMDWLLHYPSLLGLQVQALTISRAVVDRRERPGLLDGRIELRMRASS